MKLKNLIIAKLRWGCLLALGFPAIGSSHPLAVGEGSQASASLKLARDIVTQYVKAEESSGSLESFCTATRPLVIPTEDGCPPHTSLAIVDEAATRISCKPAGEHAKCQVTYRVIRSGIYPLTIPRLATPRASVTVTLTVNLKGTPKIQEPYLAPMLGRAAVMQVIDKELARTEGNTKVSDYRKQISEVKRSLETQEGGSK